MKKSWNGFLVKVGRFYYWKFKNPLTGKYTQRVIRNEVGDSISLRAEAEEIVRLQSIEKQKIEDLESKAEYLTRIAELKKLIRISNMPLDSIWTSYLGNPTRPDSGDATLKGYQDALSIFLRWLKSHYSAVRSIREITPQMAEAFALFYWGSGISGQTYNARIGACKLIFRTLVGEDHPFREIRKRQEEKQSRNAFSTAQLQAISSTLENPDYSMLHKEQMKIMMLIMLYTGCRGEDACLMRWDNVNFINRQICYIPKKTTRRRKTPLQIPMADILHETLRAALDFRTDEFILPDVARRYQNTPSGISRDISHLLEFSGIQTTEKMTIPHRKKAVVRYSMHSFRHTFCSLSVNRGIGLPVIQSIVGHTSETMTRHYAHITLESKQNAIQAVCNETSSRYDHLVWQDWLSHMDKAPKEKLSEWLEHNLSESQKIKLIQEITG